MHGMVVWAARVVFIAATCAVVSLFVVTMPDRTRPATKKTVRNLILLGIVIAGVCLLTDKLYVTPA